MNNLKFRAWDKRQKRMAYGVDVRHGEPMWGGSVWNGAPLMQSTGLFDKNGKEIYEGDIVQNEFLSVNKIVFADGGFKVTSGTSVGNYLGHFVENLEVIGNIYENPELLNNQN